MEEIGQMTQVTQILANLGSLILIVGLGLGWMVRRFDKKFEAVHRDLEAINSRIGAVENRLGVVETRLTVVETILAMFGAPIRGFQDNKKNLFK